MLPNTPLGVMANDDDERSHGKLGLFFLSVECFKVDSFIDRIPANRGIFLSNHRP